MKPESLVRILAGSFVLAGIALTLLVSRWWLLLPSFVGANLLQSGFTGFCPPTLILSKLGWLGPDGTIHWGGRRDRLDGSPR
ncbi:MAG: DUF2892 domain-containing protein [Opitutaceae bacterium]